MGLQPPGGFFHGSTRELRSQLEVGHRRRRTARRGMTKPAVSGPTGDLHPDRTWLRAGVAFSIRETSRAF